MILLETNTKLLMDSKKMLYLVKTHTQPSRVKFMLTLRQSDEKELDDKKNPSQEPATDSRQQSTGSSDQATEPGCCKKVLNAVAAPLKSCLRQKRNLRAFR